MFDAQSVPGKSMQEARSRRRLLASSSPRTPFLASDRHFSEYRTSQDFTGELSSTSQESMSAGLKLFHGQNRQLKTAHRFPLLTERRESYDTSLTEGTV